MKLFDWSEVQLAEREWLWLLLLIPVLLFLRKTTRGRASLLFSSLTTLKVAKSTQSLWLRQWIPSILRMLAFVFLVLALARPYQTKPVAETPIANVTPETKASGVDILIAVDLSASMLALDMSESSKQPTTRLDVVKRVIEDFIDKRKNDRIGLVGFASEPYRISPLTLDKKYLLDQCREKLKVGLTEETGTNIGGALAESINRVRTVKFEVSAVTSNDSSASTEGEVAISFFINGAWTKEDKFFKGAKAGEIMSKVFEMSSNPPTKLRLVAKSSDTWGYWKIIVDGKTVHEDVEGRIIVNTQDSIAEYNLKEMKRTRIVILLTDGKDDPPPRHSPLIFAKGAKEEGIKIYTIAVGRHTETASYMLDPKTREILRHPNGAFVIKRAIFPVDKKILSKIADTAGGRFYEAGDEASLRNIYEEIDRLEKNVIHDQFEQGYESRIEKEEVFEELFHLPLAAGLVLLLIEIVLSRTLLLRIP